MLRSFVVIGVVLSTLSAVADDASARIPPMSESQLERNSNLIVNVKVVKVAAYGKAYKDHCYHWQNYEATLRIEKWFKGLSPKTITIVFATRGGDVNPQRRCVGGRTSYYLSRGTRYKLYLWGHRNKRTKKLSYSFISWSGVRRLAP